MKQTYEKPFSIVVQMATENIIATSEITAIMPATELDMTVNDAADTFGGQSGPYSPQAAAEHVIAGR